MSGSKSGTMIIKRRYDRLAPFFDAMEGALEWAFFKRWREILWSKVQGPKILEVGVGTGKNFPCYPPGCEIVAIDFSEKMLQRARQKSIARGIAVELQLMDVQQLAFADDSFDTVVATFVFCSVPDPLQGLQELYRVCKPGGKLVLLEHVLSSRPPLARLMNFLNPLVVSMVGANINRKTLDTVRQSGFHALRLDAVSGDIVKLFTARK